MLPGSWDYVTEFLLFISGPCYYQVCLSVLCILILRCNDVETFFLFSRTRVGSVFFFRDQRASVSISPGQRIRTDTGCAADEAE